jgi:hypothetical protein
MHLINLIKEAYEEAAHSDLRSRNCSTRRRSESQQHKNRGHSTSSILREVNRNKGGFMEIYVEACG